MMKKIASITLLTILVISQLIAALQLMAVPVTASSTGGREDLIIVFKGPVTADDVKYLEALGGVVKYTYTIIDGVAVDLPQGAADRLRGESGGAGVPGSDTIAGRINYIEPDGVMYALGGTAPEEKPSTLSSLPERITSSLANSVHIL